MTDYFQTLVQTKKKAPIIDLSDTELSFVLSPPSKLKLTVQHADLLEYLLYQITRNPKNLIAHIQRIFFCYREDLPEQLAAGLVDLMIALGNRGTALKRRMLIGAKDKLNLEQWQLIQEASQAQKNNKTVPFALLTSGIIGCSCLITQSKHKTSQELDALALAHDYINYSQLDEAKAVLESAILEDIEMQALQQELLTLYRSTQDTAGYRRMADLLAEFGNSHQHLWNELRSSFLE